MLFLVALYSIKPDVVAPGHALTSALSNGNAGASCGTTTMSGMRYIIRHDYTTSN